MILEHTIVLAGPELVPRRCRRLVVTNGMITGLDLEAGDPVIGLEEGMPSRVVVPGLWNGHTHVGDAALPDGATGLTLEQGFFRPDGYKYRELAKLERGAHVAAMRDHLAAMAASGTVGHLDFREQGVEGARRLREASATAGVRSIILSQFDTPPFSEAELAANTAPLPPAARLELAALMEVADGFSESTYNDLTDPAWQTIREATATRGRLRAIHCLENAGYRDVSVARTGRGDLQRALDGYDPHLVVHLTVATDDEIQLLADRAVTAVVNPRANAVLGLPLPPVAKLLRAGVNLLLGTDNGMLNGPNLLAELDFTFKLARSQAGGAGWPAPVDILRMATVNVAKALGETCGGWLAQARPADFFVVDFGAPHLRRSRHLLASLVTRVTPADLLVTVIGGRPVYRRPLPGGVDRPDWSI